MAATNDGQKTSEQLIEELQRLRQRVAELQESENERRWIEKALRDSEATSRALFDRIADPVFVFEQQTKRFLDCNQAAIDRYGYTLDELQAMTPQQLHPPGELETVERNIDDQEVTSPHRYTHITKGGESFPVEIHTDAIEFEGRKAWISVARDITERKRAEEALRKAHEELERRAASLERRTAQLRVASEVAREAAAILDVQQLLDETVHLVSDRFGFYHAGVFLVDEQNEYAVLRAASSEGGRRMWERGHKLRIGEAGIAGRVAATGEPRVALDVGEDAVFFDNPDLPDTRSEMALPLNVRGWTIGVLDVQSTQEAAFSEDDVAALQTLADQLGIAIENARLVERTEAQLRELSLLHGEYSAATWSKLASPERLVSYVYDRVDVRPAGELAIPALDAALERGKTIAIAEPETMEAVLATPLKLRDQIIGALGIQETGGAREWSPNEIALVEAVSEQVALALESARLFSETQKSAQQMQALYETSRVLASSLEEETLMRAILEAVYRALGCEHVLISAVDEEANTVGVRHGIWRGEFDVFPAWIEAAQFPLDHPDILADICRTGRTEIIGEWDERFNRGIWDKFGHERFLRIFMPIKMRERVIGVVEAGYDKHEKDQVSEEEVQMLAAFMDQAAVALENARLFEAARTHAEELAALNELGQALTARLDVEEVLDEAYRRASRLLDTANFYVALYDPDRDEVTFALDVAGGEVRKPYTRRRAGQGLTEHIIRNRRPVLVQENLPERLAEMGIEQIGRMALSWLGVPLLVGDRVLGVMAVQSYTTPRAYGEHDRELLVAIASQTAIALQNAYLYRQAERRAWREGVAREIGARVTGSIDLKRILQTTARELSHALGASHAVIRIARAGEATDEVASRAEPVERSQA